MNQIYELVEERPDLTPTCEPQAWRISKVEVDDGQTEITVTDEVFEDGRYDLLLDCGGVSGDGMWTELSVDRIIEIDGKRWFARIQCRFTFLVRDLERSLMASMSNGLGLPNE